jgi:thymidylate synthase
MKYNYLDEWYQSLLSLLVSEDQSFNKSDRTGTGTKSLFGIQFRHNMSDGFPLLTTKKMAWKSIVTELLWFLRGETNIKFLLDYDCHIWDGDAYKNYCKFIESDANQNNKLEIVKIPESKEIFIKTIKCDDEIVRKMGRRYCENFTKQWGNLGPIYGKQWRSWTQYEIDMPGFDAHFDETETDQIQNLINELKTNPDSRRLMVNAWNVGELYKMVLPPCHYGFQVYTRELTYKERYDYWFKNNYQQGMEKNYKIEPDFDNTYYEPTPKRAISLMWNQRSVDTFLGLPFNIASYALLLEILAKTVNMIPDELIGNLGDVHLYLNHIEQVKEQIGRKLSFDERYALYTGNSKTWEEDGGNAYGKINGLDIMDDAEIPTRTRQPFKLPRLKILDNKVDDVAHYEINDFELLNYESHPTIKAPLSN